MFSLRDRHTEWYNVIHNMLKDPALGLWECPSCHHWYATYNARYPGTHSSTVSPAWAKSATTANWTASIKTNIAQWQRLTAADVETGGITRLQNVSDEMRTSSRLADTALRQAAGGRAAGGRATRGSWRLACLLGRRRSAFPFEFDEASSLDIGLGPS